MPFPRWLAALLLAGAVFGLGFAAGDAGDGGATPRADRDALETEIERLRQSVERQMLRNRQLTEQVAQLQGDRVVPDLSGRPLDDVEDVASPAGWRLVHTEVPSDDVAPGLVVRQTPPPGETLEAGGTLRVEVSEEDG